MNLAELTPEGIAQLKAQHGGLFMIEVAIADGDVAVCYLKPANRNVIAAVAPMMRRGQVVEAGECILQSCWLQGDPRLNPAAAECHEMACVSAALQTADLIDGLTATVKKL